MYNVVNKGNRRPRQPRETRLILRNPVSLRTEIVMKNPTTNRLVQNAINKGNARKIHDKVDERELKIRWDAIDVLILKVFI